MFRREATEITIKALNGKYEKEFYMCMDKIAEAAREGKFEIVVKFEDDMSLDLTNKCNSIIILLSDLYYSTNIYIENNYRCIRIKWH